jgi:hypothetical protein
MRVPDRDYRPPKRLAIVIGIGLLGTIVLVSYYNYSKRGENAGSSPGTNTAPIASGNRPSTVPAQGPATTRSVLETLKHQNDIDLVMTRGWALVNKHDPKSAELAAEIFREALRDVDPGNAQFYNGLGRASLIAAKPADALEAFQKGLALDPTIADIQSGIGWAYWQLHQPYNAKQAWEAALKIDPKSPDSWSALSWIYLALGDNAKAKDGFAILIARNNKDSAAIMGLSMSRSAVQVDVKEIEKYFPLPELQYLTTPPATAPATSTAAHL